MKVVLTREAARDLDLVFDPLLSHIQKRLDALSRFPELGAPMAGPFADCRATVVEFYRIVYRIRRRATIEVLFIRDCRRAPLS